MEGAMASLKNIPDDKWELEWKIKFRGVSFAGKNYVDITENWPNSVKKMIGSLKKCGAEVEKDMQRYSSKLQKCCKTVDSYLTKLGL